MSLELRYGKRDLKVSLPSGTRSVLISPRPAPEIKNLEAALEKSFENAIGTPSLRESAKGKNSACIVIPDHTRPYACAPALRRILHTLETENLGPEKTLILVATGLHRESSAEELKEMLGSDVLSRYRVASHRATEEEAHFFLGETSLKIPAFVDARYVTSDLKILLGLVEPHLMAGYSGAGKLICPGICSEKTIRAVHSARLIMGERCREGLLEGNPVHEQIQEVAYMAAPEFVVNHVLNRDGRLHGIFSGSLVESHLQAVNAFEAFGRVEVERRFKIVVSTGGGYPLDGTLYQAIKGLSAVQAIAEEPSTVILAASCSEGLGSDSFREQIKGFINSDDFVSKALAGPTRTDEWMLIELLKVARNREVILVSENLKPEDLGKLPVRKMDSVEEALFAGLKKWGSHESIAVLPEGPYVLAALRA